MLFPAAPSKNCKVPSQSKRRRELLAVKVQILCRTRPRHLDNPGRRSRLQKCPDRHPDRTAFYEQFPRWNQHTGKWQSVL